MLGRLSTLVLLACLALGLTSAQSAPLATFTVTNTSDTGPGSLRQAIVDANSTPGNDTITFSVGTPGSSVLIEPLSVLPPTAEAVVIDGLSQGGGGYTGPPLVHLDGNHIPESADTEYGLFLGPGATVSGLIVTRFVDYGITATHPTAGSIKASIIGTNSAGAAGLGNEIGVVAGGGTTVGGVPLEDRNVISGNGVGVYVQSGTPVVQGNYIGLTPNGAAARPNANGVFMDGATSPTINRNVISGNTSQGIRVQDGAAVIRNNWIGLAGDGVSNLGNGAEGIIVESLNTGGSAIGGPGATDPNIIAFNGSTGVRIQGGTGTSLRRNRIYSNSAMGIDLDPGGVTANDPPANLDADTGVNDLQNFPVISSASSTMVSGSLDTEANQTYDVDVFSSPSCDGSGNGEGAVHVASFQIATDTAGNAPFTNQPLSPPASGFVTATATDPNGNTSEFSACQAVSGGGGGGSLMGSRANAPQPNQDTGNVANLTTFGTADWGIWGTGSSTSLAPDQSKAGESQISNLTDIPAPGAPLRGLGQFAPPVSSHPFTFSWTDGAPAASGTQVRSGLQHDGQPSAGANGAGFSFTVPADMTSRTLRIWVALNRATGQLSATLSDGSAAPFTDSYGTGADNFLGATYTLTYAAASAGETLTVTWREIAAACPGFGCDNVSIHAVALEGPGGGGGDAPPAPVLMGAVPDVPGTGGPSLGVAGVWDAEDIPDGSFGFDVQFYSVPTCGSSALTSLGSANNLETNGNGIGAFAIDGLTNVAVGTLVVATVTENETPSAISNCVVADRNNTSWPTAFETTTPTESGRLRSSGQARWFKVPDVDANSRLDVRLSNLPADYDLVVFKDIEKKYLELIGGAEPAVGPNLAVDDLNKQGADTPVDLFNTSQYNRSAWDPTNWKPNLNDNVFTSQFSPSEFSPSEFSASFTAPSEFSPSEFSPSEFSPSEFSPSEFSPSEFSAEQFSQEPWASFNPADPRAFTTAQAASVLAVSSTAGTANEAISVNTWNNTGDFYIRVQGKNGSFNPTTPFSISVTRTGDVCSGVDEFPLPSVAAVNGVKTLILKDSSRWGAATDLTALNARLQTLASRPEVDGAVVDIASLVDAQNDEADALENRGCPYAKNLVAAAIKEIVEAYRADLEHIVVVGGDAVIPFFRYPDPALLGNETLYVPPVANDTASQASLRLGYVLSDDFLASGDVVSIHGNDFPVPDVAIGRLVETPEQIVGMLDAYLATATGAVTPQSSLVTGYDFLADSANQVATRLDAIVPGASDELITNANVSPGVVSDGNNNPNNYYDTRTWTATDLRRELLGQRHDLMFLAGHFSANDALAADYRTNVLTTELPAATTLNLANSIVFSAGCHAGYNLVDGDRTAVTQPLDWVQAFAHKRATLIAGTGYQYGDTDFVAHSERLYVNLAQELGGAIGNSLLRAKQRFLEDSPGLSALDEKALLQTTLFGLPMLSVNTTPAPPPGEGSGVNPVSVEADTPGFELGLTFDDVPVTGPAGDPIPKPLNGLAGAATYLTGSNGLSLKPMQPVLPLASENITASGQSPRGVLFLGGSYQDERNTVPLTAAPATELRGIHSRFHTDVFFPPQPWTLNYFGALSGSGNTQLHVTPVQHRSESPTMTRRKFTNMNFRVFYGGSPKSLDSYCGNRQTPAPCSGDEIAVTPALSAPPTIAGVDTTYNESTDVLTFMANVVGDNVAGIQGVFVTYTNPPGSSGGGGTWQSLPPLQQDSSDPTLWKGTLSTPTPGQIDFMVQAVSGVGKVTLDNNLGAFYTHGSIPGPLDPGEDPPTPTALVFTSDPPDEVRYRQEFQVTVRLTGGAGCPADGKVVEVGIGGGLPVEIPTSGDEAVGEATVTLRASLTPGKYPLIASFAGTSACGSSDDSEDVEVIKQPTSLAIAFPVVTLTTTPPQPTPLPERTVIVTVVQGATTLTHVGRTDPQGRVRVPQSLLAGLPQGAYTVTAAFAGEDGYLGDTEMVR